MIEVNLHPAGERAKAKRGRRAARRSVSGLRGERNAFQTAMLVILILVPLAIGVVWLLQRSRAGGLEGRLQAAVSDSARLSDLRTLSDSITSREQLVRERMELIRQLDQDRFVWPHILDEVSAALPEFVWLTTISETAPLPSLTVEIRGMAATALAVTEYVRRLERSPYLGFVRILGSQQQQAAEDGPEVHAFTLLVDYTSPSTQPAGPADG